MKVNYVGQCCEVNFCTMNSPSNSSIGASIPKASIPKAELNNSETRRDLPPPDKLPVVLLVDPITGEPYH